jgi:hypothetical protein
MPFSLDRIQRNTPRDLDGGETMRRGIADALDEYMKRKQQNQDWENSVNEAGGQIDPQESTGDRVRRLGGAVATGIRSHLPGYDAHEPEKAAANMAAHPMPGPSTTPSTAAAHDSSIALHSYTPSGTSVTTRATINETHPSSPSTRPSIANEIERTIVRGPNGQSAIMPTRRGSQQQEQYDKEAAKGRDEDAQIAALSADNHMPESEARARVLTNTVRYDDVYGQKNRSGLSGQEYDRRSAEQQQYRLQLEDYRTRALAARKAGDPFAERRYRIMEENLRLRAEQQGISIDEALARTPDPDPIKATMNRDNPAAAANETTRQQATGRLKNKRAEIAGGGGPKAVLTQAQYDKGKAQGKTDADLSQHYDISKVRRRPDLKPNAATGN